MTFIRLLDRLDGDILSGSVDVVAWSRKSNTDIMAEESIRNDLLSLFDMQHDSGRYPSCIVSEFGLPDWDCYDAVDPDRRDRLALSLRDMVRWFEPRLFDVRVETLYRPDLPPGFLTMELVAKIRHNEVPFHFFIVISPG